MCLSLSKAVAAPGVYTPPTGSLFKGVSCCTMPPPACGGYFLAPGTTKLNKCGLSATSFISCQAATSHDIETIKNNQLNSDVYFHPKLDLGTKHVPIKV